MSPINVLFGRNYFLATGILLVAIYLVIGDNFSEALRKHTTSFDDDSDRRGYHGIEKWFEDTRRGCAVLVASQQEEAKECCAMGLFRLDPWCKDKDVKSVVFDRKTRMNIKEKIQCLFVLLKGKKGEVTERIYECCKLLRIGKKLEVCKKAKPQPTKPPKGNGTEPVDPPEP